MEKEQKDEREMAVLNSLLMATLNMLRAQLAIRWVIAGAMIAAGFAGINFIFIAM